MPFTYRVKTVCTAFVGEEWIVTSDRPLTEDEAESAVLDDYEDIEGVTSLDCVESDVSDEHDRYIVSITDETR